MLRSPRSTLFPYTTLFRSYAVVPLVDRLTFQWTVRDLDMRGSLIVQAAQEPLVELMRSGPGARQRVLRYFQSIARSEEHTSELQSQSNLVCRLLLEKKKLV